MERSENITELAAALVAAQSKIAGAVKGKENPHFRSKYADLRSVAEACKEPLNANGIAYVQTPEPSEDGFLSLTTTLIHKSGQWISGTCKMPLPQKTPQAYGSALTYARRYGLASMAGVCPEDDDGEGAEGRDTKEPGAKEPSADEQFQIRLDESLDARGFTPPDKTALVKWICTRKKLQRLSQLKPDDRSTLLAMIAMGDLDKLKKAVA